MILLALLSSCKEKANRYRIEYLLAFGNAKGSTSEYFIALAIVNNEPPRVYTRLVAMLIQQQGKHKKGCLL